MSQDTVQENLFEDPLGLRFRHARERLRWSLEAAAQQLKLPTAVLDAIEREDWPRLGPAIFARSYISSYARLLGLPAALADDAIPGRAQPELVAAVGSVPARRVARRPRGARRFLAVLAVLVVLGLVAWAIGLPDIARGWFRGAPTVATPAASASAASAPEPGTGVPVALPADSTATTGTAAALASTQSGGATVGPGARNAAMATRFTVSSDGSIHPSAID